MLKSVLTASAAVVALVALSTSSFAADVTSTVTVSGSVAAMCSLGGNPTSYAVDMGALQDANDFAASVTKSATYLSGAYCNGAGSTLTLTTTPLTHTFTGTVPLGFTNKVDFKLVATSGAFSGGSFDTATDTSPTTTNIGIFTTGTGGGTITTDAQTTSKLVAGSYSGSIVITLHPAA